MYNIYIELALPQLFPPVVSIMWWWAAAELSCGVSKRKEEKWGQDKYCIADQGDDGARKGEREQFDEKGGQQKKEMKKYIRLEVHTRKKKQRAYNREENSIKKRKN